MFEGEPSRRVPDPRLQQPSRMWRMWSICTASWCLSPKPAALSSLYSHHPTAYGWMTFNRTSVQSYRACLCKRDVCFHFYPFKMELDSYVLLQGSAIEEGGEKNRCFAASSGLNSCSKPSRVVEQCAGSTAVRDDVLKFDLTCSASSTTQHRVYMLIPGRLTVTWCCGKSVAEVTLTAQVLRWGHLFSHTLHSFYAFICGSIGAFKKRHQDLDSHL